MCDTFVLPTPAGMLLAKNSDRDPNEAQLWEWTPARDHAVEATGGGPGARADLTFVSLPQVARTHATVVSRPWWMWGAEMGANEHGVAIGNEAVFTTEPVRREPGLLGMDLLRLALERATDARGAVEVMVGLLEEHGQSGPCSIEHPRFSYHNSFLVADRDGAVVLETAGRHWAAEEVTGRARSISNGLTIEPFAARFSDRLRSRVGRCAVRQRLTQRGADRAGGALDAMAVLRDNGTSAGPQWSRLTGSMIGPNMHGGGLLASSQTVSSWVSDPVSGRHWSTGAADPALSLFVPLRVDDPVPEADYPTAGVASTADDRSRWWRHERLHRLALRDWEAAESLLARERDDLQRRWLADPPATVTALRTADEVEGRWLDRLRERGHGSWEDTRPRWLQRRWAAYDRAAGLVPDRPLGATARVPSVTA